MGAASCARGARDCKSRSCRSQRGTRRTSRNGGWAGEPDNPHPFNDEATIFDAGSRQPIIDPARNAADRRRSCFGRRDKVQGLQMPEVVANLQEDGQPLDVKDVKVWRSRGEADAS